MDQKRGKLIITTNFKTLIPTIKYSKLPIYPDVIKLQFHKYGIRFSKDPFLNHKTGSWGKNLDLILKYPNIETIFYNEKNEICETSKFNIYIQIENILYTPPISSGILPGTYRDYLLDKKEIVIDQKKYFIKVKKIYKKEINKNCKLWVSNSLIGLKKGKFLEIDC